MSRFKGNLGFTCPNLEKDVYLRIKDICKNYSVTSNVPINYWSNVVQVLQEHPEYLTEEGVEALSTMTKTFRLLHPERISPES